MILIKKLNILSFKTDYNNNKFEKYSKIKVEDSGYLRIYSGALINFTSLNELFNKPKCDLKLEDLKTLYFSKNSKFPRFKLSQFTNIKRCIKKEKASAIVYSKNGFQDTNCRIKFVYFSPSVDEYYFFDYSVSYYITNITLKTGKSKFEVMDDILKTKKVIPDDAYLVKNTNIYLLSKNEVEVAELLLDDSLTFIEDLELDKLISKNLNNVDNYDLNSINEMLKSEDASTVGLGMDLLINYNIYDKACAIGFIIYENANNILKNPKVSSVGFKSILNSLNITKNELQKQIYINNILRVNNLYKLSTNEEDKKLAYNLAIKLIKDKYKSFTDEIKACSSNMNISINIDIK